jgi:hypothetical protein
VAQEREAAAGAEIDRLLRAAGLAVQDFNQADIHAARGIAFASCRSIRVLVKRIAAPCRRRGGGRGRGQEPAGLNAYRRRSAVEQIYPESAGKRPRPAPPAAFHLRVHRRRDPLYQRPRPRAACPPHLRLPQAGAAGRLVARPAASHGALRRRGYGPQPGSVHPRHLRIPRPPYTRAGHRLADHGLWPTQITAIRNRQWRPMVGS